MNCPLCKGEMQPLVSGTNPDSSEHYCHACHKSVKMDKEQAITILLERERLARAAAAAGS